MSQHVKKRHDVIFFMGSGSSWIRYCRLWLKKTLTDNFMRQTHNRYLIKLAYHIEFSNCMGWKLFFLNRREDTTSKRLHTQTPCTSNRPAHPTVLHTQPPCTPNPLDTQSPAHPTVLHTEPWKRTSLPQQKFNCSAWLLINSLLIFL